MILPKSLQRAINELSKLPSIGPKSAQRLALFLLKKEQPDITLLAKAIEEIKSTVHYCEICHIMADESPCITCSDTARNHAFICVVEESLDAIAIERSGFTGVFHVLGGVLNPLEGIGPDKLQILSLVERIKNEELRIENKEVRNQSGNEERPDTTIEIILATNPTLEGEATARYIAKLLTEKLPSIKITRIARGIPTGGDLEYADDLTLSKALEGRRDF